MFNKRSAIRFTHKVYPTPQNLGFSTFSKEENKGHHYLEQEIEPAPLTKNTFDHMNSNSRELEEYAQNKAEKMQYDVMDSENKKAYAEYLAEQQRKTAEEQAKHRHEEEEKKQKPQEMTIDTVPTTHLLKRPKPAAPPPPPPPAKRPKPAASHDINNSGNNDDDTAMTEVAAAATAPPPPPPPVQREEPLGSKRVYYTELIRNPEQGNGSPKKH